MNINKLSIIIFLCFGSFLADAQFSEIGGGIGISNVRSDLGGVRTANTRYGANFFYRMNLNHIWVARAELKYFNIASSDSYYKKQISEIRNTNFSNNGIEVSFNFEFNFLNFRYPKYEHKWCPYLSAGIANFSTFGSSFGTNSLFNVAIPFGFGIKYKLSDHWNLGLNYSVSKTFSDKLDNISSSKSDKYIDKIKGNDASTNDWYHYLGFSVSYTIYKMKCPDHLEDETTPEYWQRQFR